MCTTGPNSSLMWHLLYSILTETGKEHITVFFFFKWMREGGNAINSSETQLSIY